MIHLDESPFLIEKMEDILLEELEGGNYEFYFYVSEAGYSLMVDSAGGNIGFYAAMNEILAGIPLQGEWDIDHRWGAVIISFRFWE